MNHPSCNNQERGAVLAIGLVLLLVMTIVGVTAIQSTTLDERMAANTRSRNLAFQSAEAAMADAMLALRNGTASFSTTQPNPLDDGNWSAHNPQTYTGTIAGVVARPVYVIEDLGISAFSGSALVGGGISHWYRITARGWGATNTAIVVLEKIVSWP